MALTLRNGLRFGGINELKRESCPVGPFSKSVGLKNEFNFVTKKIELKMQSPPTDRQLKCNSKDSTHVENPVEPSHYTAWWKRAHENYRDISSVEDFINSLHDAGDKLVVVEFYSPPCGGCRGLHPKMYQIAEEHQEAIFLKVNLDVHKFLGDALIVRVLPFFHFYRGTLRSRIHSFSCTLRTIHKMKDALKKYGNVQSGPDPAKGLEGELLTITSDKETKLDDPGLLTLTSDKETKLDDPVEVSGDRGELALHAANAN